MYDEKSVYPKIETESAFKPRLNDVFVNDSKNQTFFQDGNDSVIYKKYNPFKLISTSTS